MFTDATGFSHLLERLMEYILSLAVALALGVYLIYALLRPERF
jgi:K+-transporting ATPase KdpF subunit